MITQGVADGNYQGLPLQGQNIGAGQDLRGNHVGPAVGVHEIARDLVEAPGNLLEIHRVIRGAQEEVAVDCGVRKILFGHGGIQARGSGRRSQGGLPRTSVLFHFVAPPLAQSADLAGVHRGSSSH